jgi:ERF superfamily
MGAALTYARRYALFALVGIAGEDDLDAPDLNAPEPVRGIIERPMSTSRSRLNGGRSQATRTQTVDLKAAHRPLKDQLSAVLRDQLLGQLEAINSAEEAAIWAHRILTAKNRLNAANAQQVETAFEAKLKNLQGEAEVGEVPPSAPCSASQHSSNLNPPIFPPTKSTNQENIENGHFVRVRSRRVRDKEHLRFVAKQPCLICGRTPADAHHLRFSQHHALGQKVSDEFTVPLCRGHHREVHRYGNEAEWWKRTTIDPTITARALWLKTHPLSSARSRD